jgi:hypothetical protein
MPTYRFEFVVRLPEDEEIGAQQANYLAGTIASLMTTILGNVYKVYDVDALAPFEQVSDEGKIHLTP